MEEKWTLTPVEYSNGVIVVYYHEGNECDTYVTTRHATLEGAKAEAKADILSKQNITRGDEILQKLDQGMSQAAIARQYGVSRQAIHKIVRRLQKDVA